MPLVADELVIHRGEGRGIGGGGGAVFHVWFPLSASERGLGGEVWCGGAPTQTSPPRPPSPKRRRGRNQSLLRYSHNSLATGQGMPRSTRFQSFQTLTTKLGPSSPPQATAVNALISQRSGSSSNGRAFAKTGGPASLVFRYQCTAWGMGRSPARSDCTPTSTSSRPSPSQSAMW